jgi:hypothetical protein
MLQQEPTYIMNNLGDISLTYGMNMLQLMSFSLEEGMKPISIKNQINVLRLLCITNAEQLFQKKVQVSIRISFRMLIHVLPYYFE